MIFVTVGTHEQPFDRLIKKIDDLVKESLITEEVFIQTGFSNYVPQYCKYSKMLSYEEMNEKLNNSRIIITHGGPASFMAPLSINKIPIVVPRQKKFNEHVNDHQLQFCREVSKRKNNIILVEDINELPDKIINYDEIIQQIKGSNFMNNENFTKKLIDEINKLFK